MPGCVIKRCTSRPERGMRLFKFPSLLRNAERRKLWEEFVNRKHLPLHSQICELHFSDAQFELKRADNKKKLKWNAVPDVYVLPTKRHVEPSKQEVSPIEENKGLQNLAEIINFTVPEQQEQPDIQLPYITDHSYCNKNDKNEEYVSHYNNYITLYCNLKRQLLSELKAAERKIKHLEKKIMISNKNYKDVFNKDQHKMLMSGSGRVQVWSESTIQKALKLYMICGPKGYEEILRQKLPYPSIRTLQRIKMKKKEDVMNLLEDKVTTKPPEETHVVLLTDGITLTPRLENNCG